MTSRHNGGTRELEDEMKERDYVRLLRERDEARQETERYAQEARETAREHGVTLRELEAARAEIARLEKLVCSCSWTYNAAGDLCMESRDARCFVHGDDEEATAPDAPASGDAKPAHRDLDWAANRDTDTADLLGDGGLVLARLDYLKFLTFMEMTENTREFLAVGRCPACHGVDGTHTVRACMAATTPAVAGTGQQPVG